MLFYNRNSVTKEAKSGETEMPIMRVLSMLPEGLMRPGGERNDRSMHLHACCYMAGVSQTKYAIKKMIKKKIKCVCVRKNSQVSSANSQSTGQTFIGSH